MIRIPSKPDALKLFRCKFCPGEGTKFVGLSEESFLDHISNKHGNKVARKRPGKLVRECRICGPGSNWATDAELSKHCQQVHLDHGTANTAPFAGTGPRGSGESGERVGAALWARGI